MLNDITIERKDQRQEHRDDMVYFENFDHGWGIVKEKFIDLVEEKLKTKGTKKIIFPNRAYMEIHDTVYEMCTQRAPYNYSKRIYDTQGDTINDYLQRVVIPAIEEKRVALVLVQHRHMVDNDNSTDKEDYSCSSGANDSNSIATDTNRADDEVAFLEELQFRWNNHVIMKKHYSIFFGYLDKWYVKHHSLPSVKESVSNAFKENVYQGLNLENDTLDTLIQFIDKNRRRRRARHCNIGGNSTVNNNNSLVGATSDGDCYHEVAATANLTKSIIGMYKEMGGCMNELERRLLKSLQDFCDEKWKVDLIGDHSVEECVAELREVIDEETKMFVTYSHILSESQVGEEIIGKWLLERIFHAVGQDRVGDESSINNKHFLQKIVDVHHRMEINKCQLKSDYIRISQEYYSQLRIDWMKNRVLPVFEYMVRAEKLVKDEIQRTKFYVQNSDWAIEIIEAILEELITKFAIEFIVKQNDK